EAAGAFEGDTTAADDAAALTHRRPGSAIEVVPELLDRRMGRTPFALELLNFGVGEAIGLEFPPGVEAAHIAEGKIARFADAALWRVLGVGAGRYAEDPACSLTIWLITRIVGCVIAAVSIKLPGLASRPRQHPRFDGAKIGANQYMSGRRNDHRPGAVT